jgi:hypothetical protein
MDKKESKKVMEMTPEELEKSIGDGIKAIFAEGASEHKLQRPELPIKPLLTDLEICKGGLHEPSEPTDARVIYKINEIIEFLKEYYG